MSSSSRHQISGIGSPNDGELNPANSSAEESDPGRKILYRYHVPIGRSMPGPEERLVELWLVWNAPNGEVSDPYAILTLDEFPWDKYSQAIPDLRQLGMIMPWLAGLEAHEAKDRQIARSSIGEGTDEVFPAVVMLDLSSFIASESISYVVEVVLLDKMGQAQELLSPVIVVYRSRYDPLWAEKFTKFLRRIGYLETQRREVILPQLSTPAVGDGWMMVVKTVDALNYKLAPLLCRSNSRYWCGPCRSIGRV